MEPIGPLSPVITGPNENRTMFEIYLSICCVFIFFNFAGFLLEVTPRNFQGQWL